MTDSIKQKSTKRIKLCEIHVKANGDSLLCVSKLSYGKEEVTSKVESKNTASNRKNAVAQTVLEGVRQLMNLKEQFTAINVIVNTLEDMTFISVITEIKQDKFTDRAVGSAIVKTDINEAIGKAALNSVNRRIERLAGK